MKKYLFAVSFVFITAFAFAQNDPASAWAKTNITIDGNAQEWNPPLKHYDSNSRLFFDFKNDSNNLYLCFQSTDEMNHIKITRAGMKIILESKINGKHKGTISFPLTLKQDSAAASSEREMRTDPAFSFQKMHTAFLSGDTLMEVKGFTNKNGLIPSYDTSGIHAAINWDQKNTLTYEIAIPLKELLGNNYDIKDVSKNISLNVIINAMKRPARSESSNGENEASGGGGGMSEGRNGMGGMGRGGGRTGGQRYNQFQTGGPMYEKSELKQKFALATNE